MSTVLAPQSGLDLNPFVGPRAFQLGEAIYARDRDTRRLVNLLVAERIVLLYSPSGAGKSSLINAGLIPALRERHFQVSPAIRVSHRPANQVTDRNRYVVSTLQSLEEGLRGSEQRSPEELAAMTLDAYLREWGRQDHVEGNELLIFDQFEELLVLDPTDDAEKREFLVELGAALEERGRRALFSMREDHIAGLDPYLEEIPTRLRTRYRLELLSPAGARHAIEKPAEAAGRPFQPPATTALVETLRRVQVQSGGQLVYVPGPVVEPLQLQVVCRRLWDSMPRDAREITAADVDRVGRIEDALADYYAEEIEKVARDTGVAEREIRDWFGEQLITEQGIRRQQQRGPGRDGRAAELAARQLEDAHLIRGEVRRGTQWLELAHDQLVEPIRKNNAAWRRSRLSPLQQQAAQWASQDHPSGLLLTGKGLTEAARWAAEHKRELTALDNAFLEACLAARWRRNRRNTLVLCSLLVAFSVALVVAVNRWQDLQTAREEEESRAYATKAHAALSADNPGLAVRLAERGLAITPTPEAENVLHRALSQNLTRAVWSHEDGVNSVVFSPDGEGVLTSSWDSTARLWDSVTGAQLRLLEHDGGVRDAQFSSDGERILTVSETRIRLWRADDPQQPPVELEGDWGLAPLPQRRPPRATFSPDGSRVAAIGDKTNEVHVFDASTGARVLPALSGHHQPINVVAFSAAGDLLVTASEDGTARVWDTATGASRAVLGGHRGAVTGAAFRDDGHAVATIDGEGDVRIWRWPDLGAPLTAQAQARGTAQLTFNTDGTLLAYGDKSPVLFDSDTGKSIAELNGHRGGTSDARLSADGRRAVTASVDGTARAWDIRSGRELAAMHGHEAEVAAAAIDPAGQTVATISGASVRLFRLPVQRLLPGYRDWVHDAEFLPDGTKVAAGGQDGRVLVWDHVSGAVLAELLPGPDASIRGIDVDSEGRYISAAAEDGSVRVWDWQRQQVVAERQIMARATSTSFGSDGTTLVVGGDSLALWNWASPEDPRPIASGRSHAANFSPHEDLLAVGRGQDIELWRSTGTGPERTLHGHVGDVTGLDFSTDGPFLVSASTDGTARVWDIDSGKSVALEGHQGPVWSAAFNRAGDRIVTGGDDGLIGVWDAHSGANIAMLPRHGDTVNAVHFNPVSADLQILSASDDGTVRVSECETCRPGDRDRILDRTLIPEDARRLDPTPSIGQCFMELPGPEVDCAEPHRDEVYAVVTQPDKDGAPYPSENPSRWAVKKCQGEAYTHYRGKDHAEDPRYHARAYGPSTSMEWELGQRTHLCLLWPENTEETTGSARESGGPLIDRRSHLRFLGLP